MIFENGLVLGIGEILWDLLPEGRQLGGAPANFAFHCKQLGASAIVASSVGNDQPGAKIKDFLAWNHIGDLVQTDPKKPTGVVEVHVDSNGVPTYNIIENVAWDYMHYNSGIGEIAKTADVICFGSLAQRNDVSKLTIQRTLKESNDKCLRIFDINIRQDYYSKQLLIESLILANVLKINGDELDLLIRLLDLPIDPEKAIESLMQQFDLRLLALTMGEKGSSLHMVNERSFLETPKVQVLDTVGAGDSFTAALAVGLLKGLPLSDVHAAAVALSAYVCTMKGATPKHEGLQFFKNHR